MVDVAPVKIWPTWRNKRSGDQAVSKRLDRFLVLEYLISSNLILKASVEIGGTSYHCHIVLSVKTLEVKIPAPFKFKPQWLEEEEYCNLIRKAWVPLLIVLNHSWMQQFMENLERVKNISKDWDENYRRMHQEDLKKIEV